MGACCTKDKILEGFADEDIEEEGEEEGSRVGDCGARIMLDGSCRLASMHTQQGKKGVNQDAMTLWKDFTGESDMIFCGVFDGHGPLGHKVAGHVRDVLPSKIALEIESLKYNHNNHSDGVTEIEDDHDNQMSCSEHSSPEKEKNDLSPISLWKASFMKAFEDLDRELSVDSSIDSYCSGSTAVTLLKQDEHLMLANLGDSRAILGVRDKKNHLVSVQLTVDLKPNLPCEAERIKSCNGRVFAMEEEPDVYRLWLPEDDSPGLAMARAFGDFCLKDFGLISTPKLSYRKITCADEFVVIATDGVWDVLTNKEVVKIVGSAKRRSMAAKVLVGRANQAWKLKYPCSKVDDCAVIILFLKPLSVVSRSGSLSESNLNKCTRSESHLSGRSMSTESRDTQGTRTTHDEWSALEGVSRVNTVMKMPRFSSEKRYQKRSETDEDEDGFVST